MLQHSSIKLTSGMIWIGGIEPHSTIQEQARTLNPMVNVPLLDLEE